MTRLLLCMLALASIINAVDIRGRIQWNEVCLGPRELGPARVILDDGKLAGGVVTNGSFTIHNVPEGIYILSVLAHDIVFDQLRIDVLTDSVEARPYAPATPLDPPHPTVLPYPLVLTPRISHKYFVLPESFNILGMLKSPMVLMMIVTGVMVLAMPYLMKNMDPESLEEFKEQQAKMVKMQNALTTGDFKSGLSAMLSGQEDPKDAISTSPKTTTTTGGKGKGKKKK